MDNNIAFSSFVYYIGQYSIFFIPMMVIFRYLDTQAFLYIFLRPLFLDSTRCCRIMRTSTATLFAATNSGASASSITLLSIVASRQSPGRARSSLSIQHFGNSMATVRNAIKAIEGMMTEEQIRRAHASAERETLIRRLAELRERRGIKQSEVTTFSQTAISKLEKRKDMKLSTIIDNSARAYISTSWSHFTFVFLMGF